MTIPVMTDRRCSCCDTERQPALFLFSVRVETLGPHTTPVDVLACPACDRVRCPACGQNMGMWFAPPPLQCQNCGHRL